MLSTPTISHHMNVLLEIGLVETTVESNKIYYSMNREAMSKVLDEIKGYLLDQDKEA